MKAIVIDPTPADLPGQLKAMGAEVFLADGPAEGLRKATKIPMDLVLCRYAHGDGEALEGFLRASRAGGGASDAYVIVYGVPTGHGNCRPLLEWGADDVIAEGEEPDKAHLQLENAVRTVSLENRIRSDHFATQSSFFQTIHMFTNLIENVNEDLGGHCRRVGCLSLELTRRHGGIPAADYPLVEAAGLLHDMGMIGLPRAVISKKRNALSADELQLYQYHPVQGSMLLAEIAYLRPVARIVRHHHEQVNGNGFPDRLKGREIPLASRIVAAASEYDSLVHKRRVPRREIPEALLLKKGHELDGDLVDILLSVNREAMDQDRLDGSRPLVADDLEEGMVLSRSVRRDNGALVLPSGTRLTPVSIDKLRRFSELGCIPKTVHIYHTH